MFPQYLLYVKNLTTYYDGIYGTVKAVDGVDLWLRKGEILGMVGESGGGKSVAACSILRLIVPPGRIVNGEVWFHDKDLLRISRDELNDIRGNKISMIFQSPHKALHPLYSVGNQVGEPLEVHEHFKRKLIREKVIEYLGEVSLPNPGESYYHYIHQFSGGMAQRVSIAMALMCNPEILIADEPVRSLDSTIQSCILELLKDLRRNFGLTMLLITHDLGVIAEMADSVVVIYAGKVMEYADVETIFHRSKHPYTEALLEAVPWVGKGKRLKPIPGDPPTPLNFPSGCRFHPRCEHATWRCSVDPPRLVEIEPGHFVRCLLAGPYRR
ncbi:MAG: ABC transporter ATP-binding protein [bacterium]